jgi:hypothetical protein
MRGNLPAFSLNILASEIQHLLIRGVCEGARGSILRPVDLSGVPGPHTRITYHLQRLHTRITCANCYLADHECRVTDSDARASRCMRVRADARVPACVPCSTHTRMCLGTLTRVCSQTACGGSSTLHASQHAGVNGEESVPACGGQRASWRSFCPWRPCRRQLLSLLLCHTTHKQLPPPPLGRNRACGCR